MSQKTMTQCALLAGAARLALSACAAQTKLGAAWKDPAYSKGRIRKVLVIGVAQNENRRRAFEDQFVSTLKVRGVAAEASATLVPDVKNLNKETIKAAIDGKGYDSVIVTRLVGVDVKYTRSPGGYDAVPACYNSLYGDYGQAYYVVQAPESVDSKTTVSLETNLYETATEKLVWSVQSKSFKKESIFDSIQGVIEALMKQMAQDGLV